MPARRVATVGILQVELCVATSSLSHIAAPLPHLTTDFAPLCADMPWRCCEWVNPTLALQIARWRGCMVPISPSPAPLPRRHPPSPPSRRPLWLKCGSGHLPTALVLLGRRRSCHQGCPSLMPVMIVSRARASLWRHHPPLGPPSWIWFFPRRRLRAPVWTWRRR